MQMQQRYYDPMLGLFLSVDPVTAYGSSLAQFNRYGYANGNPYRFVDSDGRIGYELNQGSTIIIPVYFQGSGATEELVGAIMDRANSLVVAGMNISVVRAEHLVGGVNVMNLAPHSRNPHTQFGEGVVEVSGYEHLGNMAAHINSARGDAAAAALHDILHFIGLKDGYIENPLSSKGDRRPTVGYEPGYFESQVMASTQGNEIRSHEIEGLRSPNNGMRSGVEWRRVQGRLDALKKAGKIR